MEKKGNKEKMAFVLPSSIEIPPEPQNKNVQIIQSKEAYFAAIGYGGYSTKGKSEYYTKILKENLNENKLKIQGDPILLGYNSPYKFFNRLNEIIIEVAY